MSETTWGGILFLIILCTPIAFFFFTAWLIGWIRHKRFMKELPIRDLAQAKQNIRNGMYDQMIHEQALGEVMAEGALEIEDELKIQRIIKEMKRRGELNG